ALREDPEFKDKFDDWYNEEAIRQLVQVCGRICRGPDDFGITVILDQKFGDLYKRYPDKFPHWFKEALIDYSGRLKPSGGDS
ncbi:hypothetical protein DRP04_03665, partial [Archaeoglobales archaeon]